MKVKDAGRSAQKWAERAGSASSDYADGIQNPKEDWARATNASANAWKAGINKAVTENRFSKGVTRAGSAKQIEKSLSKGVARYSQGVAVAQGDYQDGVAPYLEVIERTQLPPRGPKGDPNNLQRVAAIDTALHAAKNARR